MLLTVLCNGEPIGRAELDPVQIWGSAPLIVLPGFESIRPVLERADQALADLSMGMLQAKFPAAPGPGLPVSGPESEPTESTDPEQCTVESTTLEALKERQPNLAREIDELSVAYEPAARLAFSLRDSSGTAVPAEHVKVWAAIRTSMGEMPEPLVQVIFNFSRGTETTP